MGKVLPFNKSLKNAFIGKYFSSKLIFRNFVQVLHQNYQKKIQNATGRYLIN